MVERRYSCDMCRTSHKADSQKLIGIHFISDNSIERAVGGVTDTERHICRNCLKELHGIYEGLKK